MGESPSRLHQARTTSSRSALTVKHYMLLPAFTRVRLKHPDIGRDYFEATGKRTDQSGEYQFRLGVLAVSYPATVTGLRSKRVREFASFDQRRKLNQITQIVNGIESPDQSTLTAYRKSADSRVRHWPAAASTEWGAWRWCGAANLKPMRSCG